MRTCGCPVPHAAPAACRSTCPPPPTPLIPASPVCCSRSPFRTASLATAVATYLVLGTAMDACCALTLAASPAAQLVPPFGNPFCVRRSLGCLGCSGWPACSGGRLVDGRRRRAPGSSVRAVACSSSGSSTTLGSSLCTALAPSHIMHLIPAQHAVYCCMWVHPQSHALSTPSLRPRAPAWARSGRCGGTLSWRPPYTGWCTSPSHKVRACPAWRGGVYTRWTAHRTSSPKVHGSSVPCCGRRVACARVWGRTCMCMCKPLHRCMQPYTAPPPLCVLWAGRSVVCC